MGVIHLSAGAEASRRRFVLVSSHLSETNAALLTTARAHFRDAALISGSTLACRLRPDDVVLARLDVLPSLDGIERGLLDLQELERGCGSARILNPPAALFVCHDKLATAITLGAAGLPHPRTACVDQSSQLGCLAPPVVVKPRFGRSDSDVFFCDTWHDVRRCFRSIAKRPWYRRHGALVQQFVHTRGPELRVTVAAGAAVGALVPQDAAQLAVRAAQTARADLVQVHLTPAPQGWIVLELSIASDIAWNDEVGSRRLCARIVERLAAHSGSQDPLRHRLAGQPAGSPVHLS